MKVFHCNHCGQTVFFENTQCTNCGRTLAYLPEAESVVSLDPIGGNLWQTTDAQGMTVRVNLCQNYRTRHVCNWALPETDPNALCTSCRLTTVIPNLEKPKRETAWFKMEAAKRRLVCGLQRLRLAYFADGAFPGLVFEFLEDPEDPNEDPILTGHANGVITLNLAEADDAERERRRQDLGEPYRTLLGHFRHEVGHYYWERLVSRNDQKLWEFRNLFGDEHLDYDAALERHYTQGAPSGWQRNYISAYATAHPWEDWAETWAHYMHIVDALETAHTSGLCLQPFRQNDPSFVAQGGFDPGALFDFNSALQDWLALAYVLNNQNRSMGHPDSYPFVLSTPVIAKLEFVHRLIHWL